METIQDNNDAPNEEENEERKIAIRLLKTGQIYQI